MSETSKNDNSLIKGMEEFNKDFKDRWVKYVKPYKDLGIDEYGYSGDDLWYDAPKDWHNIHWKFHLNVSPDNVKKVSKFLKKEGFCHKYLMGGEIESGKVFTVYTGSKKTTEKAVKLITDNVGDLLDEPKAEGESLFAPKIVGRFEGNGNEFAVKVCKNGICILWNRLHVFPEIKITDEDVQKSRNRLKQLYGDYFGDSIEYYNPSTSK